jgi:hypothetical protein
MLSGQAYFGIHPNSHQEQARMTVSEHVARRYALAFSQYLLVFLLAVGMIALAGCGSTKVYTAEKTMVYKDSLYNLSGVKQVGSRIEGNAADGTTVNLRNLDKKEVEAQLKANPGMMVTTLVMLDDQQMVYERRQVKNYSDYKKMVKHLDDAMKDISKFMADGKKTQLKL